MEENQLTQLLEHNAKSLTPRAIWNYSLDQIRRNTAEYSEDERQLLVDCFLFCVKEGIAFREFCQKIKYDHTTVMRIYRGAYANPATGEKYGIPANMAKGMRDFLETERKRLVLGTTEFVETPTARRIFIACDLAREEGLQRIYTWWIEHAGLDVEGITEYGAPEYYISAIARDRFGGVADWRMLDSKRLWQLFITIKNRVKAAKKRGISLWHGSDTESETSDNCPF